MAEEKLAPAETELFKEQQREADRAIEMFERLHFQTLIAPYAHIEALMGLSVAAIQKLIAEKLPREDCHLHEHLFDFGDYSGLEAFLEACRSHKREWEHLDDGYLDIPSYFNPKQGMVEYPLFTIINPLGIAYDDRMLREIGLKGFGRAFRYITKWGKLLLAVTPNHLEQPGLRWPAVPGSYQEALIHPEKAGVKNPIRDYLMSRKIITNYGLEQHCENSWNILTPQATLLDAAIQAEQDRLRSQV